MERCFWKDGIYLFDLGNEIFIIVKECIMLFIDIFYFDDK